MTMVNVPLLRKAVEWVEEQDKLAVSGHRSEWAQDQWMAYRTDDGLLVDGVFVDDATKAELHRLAERGECGTAYCVAGYVGQLLDESYKYTWSPDGLPAVDDFAERALGLTTNQADLLFGGVNTADDVRRIAEEIAGEKL